MSGCVSGWTISFIPLRMRFLLVGIARLLLAIFLWISLLILLVLYFFFRTRFYLPI